MMPAPASSAFSEGDGSLFRHRKMKAKKRTVPAFLLVVGVLVFGPGGYQLTRLSVIQWRLNRRLAALTAERESLQQEQQRLQSDPTYVEGLIRSTFKVAKPGEYVILPEAQDRQPKGIH